MSSIISERVPSHVLLAVADGMKAGFNQFASASSKSGLPAVKQAWSAFQPLNKKGRFNLYCATFGPVVESLGAPKVSATRAAIVEDRTSDDVQALIEQANELLAQAEALKAKPKAAKPKVVLASTKFGAGVVKALGLPTKAGKAFTYKGKHGSSKWIVAEKNRDGSIIANRV